jgi:hypothetical protein
MSCLIDINPKAHHCGRRKKLLKTWLNLSKPKTRTTFPVDTPRREAEENCAFHIEGLPE